MKWRGLGGKASAGAVVSVLTVALVSVAGQVPAHANDLVYTFQNVASDQNLDMVQGVKQLRAWSPQFDGSDNIKPQQRFAVKAGTVLPGHLLQSVATSQCLRAVGKDLAVESAACNPGVKAQLWSASFASDGDRIESTKFPGYCIQDEGADRAVVLRSCNNQTKQSWMALS
ncbi:ricin-type beta-trefoil lectin domain protein [Kitasatospora sp. NPDC089913]|uniref:ricin-type beta-trefoil lectin domain protein n=1 Tax=Streptomycetaceae TaxID=2062 RepID=UPI000879D03C|nr:ricin-type beta-trefoil lectin domain protein [Streptomyces sp. TLI_053]SDS74576.1 Ricin-type beta-trefoil lectin domain-containing protein [Streptomyces sp. TLI_053]